MATTKTRQASKASKAAETRTIRCMTSDGGEKIIEGVPARAKVTFARMNPSGKGWGSEPYALRVYTSQSDQLACFLHVEEFYDTSLTVKTKVEESVLVAANQENADGRRVERTQSTNFKFISR